MIATHITIMIMIVILIVIVIAVTTIYNRHRPNSILPHSLDHQLGATAEL